MITIEPETVGPQRIEGDHQEIQILVPGQFLSEAGAHFAVCFATATRRQYKNAGQCQNDQISHGPFATRLSAWQRFRLGKILTEERRGCGVKFDARAIGLRRLQDFSLIV